MPTTKEFPPDINPEGRPSVSVTDEHVEAWLGFEPRFTFPWPALEEVTVRIEPTLGEAWWELRGGQHSFSAPLEIVYNAESLNQRLFALPGFDRAAYDAARLAETTGEEREFLCWRKPKV
jgi:hypothetical protein